MTKNEYYRNGGLDLAWDLGINFLGIPNWVTGGLKKKFFFGLKGATKKSVGYFLVYLFLRVLFFYKKVLQDRKFKFLCETICWFAAIHTTLV